MSKPERIPDDQFPSSMSWDERAVRQALYMAWLKSVNEFRYALLIAADWFADHNHPDEAVCRANWQVRSYGSVNRERNPQAKGWWQWTVTPQVQPTGWTQGSTWRRHGYSGKGFWLCWPRGWARLTYGLRRNPVNPKHIVPAVQPLKIGKAGAPIVAWAITLNQNPNRQRRPTDCRNDRWMMTPLFHPPGARLTQSGVVPAIGLFDEAGGDE